MPTEDHQERAYRFLSARFADAKPFTKDEFRRATGWSVAAFKTYWSKQFKGLLEETGRGQFAVRGSFARFATWPKFREHVVTQVRRGPSRYTQRSYDKVIIFEFYMPLTHEGPLRTTLDSLFFREALEARLRRLVGQELQAVLPKRTSETDERYIERVLQFSADRFRGYSVYHVNGRFRGNDLMTLGEAAELQKSGDRYLIDETTAVTRFIFPCETDDEAKAIRFLFTKLFVNTITDVVSGEDEIWLVEGGLKNNVHVWKTS